MIDFRALIPFWSHKDGALYRRLVEKKREKNNDWVSDRSAFAIAFGFLTILVAFPILFFTVTQTSVSVSPPDPMAISPVLCTGQCKGDAKGSQYIQGLLCTDTKNKTCLTCGANKKFAKSPIGSCTTPATAVVTTGPAGACDGKDWTYSYTDCCSEGKSRTVTRSCQNGQFVWNYQPCTNSDSQCTQGGKSTVVCPPNMAYVEGKCYPANVCAPQCNGKACGVADGCGGVCIGACSSQDEANRAVAYNTLGGSYKFAYSALNYQKGFYTNLCGDTVTGTKSCTSACDLGTGTCTSGKKTVVKWVCDGKHIECREGESSWETSQSIGNVSCGKTVQIDVFSKNCRAKGADTWGCGIKELTDYMVWYSGDCAARPTVTYTPTPTPSVTHTPTPTVTPTPSRTPTPIIVYRYIYVTPSATPTPGGIGGAPTTSGGSGTTNQACNTTCVYTSDCNSGYFCISGQCRNGSCIDDATCGCAAGVSPTVTPFVSTGGLTPSDNGFGDLFGTPSASTACGSSCSYPIDCPSGYTCVTGQCRNVSCPAESSCNCADNQNISPTVSTTPTSQASSDRGSVWMLVLLVVVIVVVIVVAVRFFLMPH